MQRKRMILLPLLLVAALLLAACPAPTAAPATESDAAASEAEPTEAPAEEAASDDSGDGEAALVIWADETRTPILASLADAFEAEYGLKVVVTEKGFGDIRDDFKVAGPAGEGPDIIIGAHDWLGELVENGLLAEMVLDGKEADFVPNAISGFTYDGKLYGLPYATENLALFYNTDLVESPPETWDDVQTLATELEESGAVKQGFAFNTGSPYDFYPIQTSFGGYVFGRDDTGSYDPTDVGIDSEGTLAAVDWLDGMVKDGHLTGDVDWDIMHAQFENGETAMLITGPWALSRIRESGVPYAIAPIPSGGQPFMGVQGFMVSSFSEDPLLAMTFLSQFVATDEVMKAIFEADPRSPAYLPVADSIDDADIVSFAAAGVDAQPMPAIPEMSAVWSAWGDALTLVVQQSEDPVTAFKNAAEQIRSAIAGE